MNTWVVRAGERASLAEDFEARSCVAIGWKELGDLSQVASRDDLARAIAAAYPDWKPGRRRSSVGQVGAFLFDFQIGDRVLTYNREQRVYLVGGVTSAYRHQPNLVPGMPQIRSITWEGRVRRDDLSAPTRNTLGAIQTLFRLGPDAAAEIEERLAGQPLPEASATDELETEIEQVRQNVVEQAREFIKDRLLKLDWEEMQQLVAGCLRAMGYKTRISPRGADRGQDIVASPDGLGLEQPRIVVEVKHREKGAIGAPEIRAFLGGRHPQDKCLYVSTGGFSKEARYEADRASIPITLLDLDDLADLLIQHYENVDTDTRALAPLLRLYWPAT
jgi:restriction system protein